MIKAKKGLLIALFAAMMVFAFGASSAFASNTDGQHKFGDRNFSTIESVNANVDGLKVLVEPTCGLQGVGEITCTEDLNGEACGAVRTVWINALGHEKNGTFVRRTADELMTALGYTDEAKAAFYAQNPYKCYGYVYVCKNCGQYIGEDNDPLTVDNWIEKVNVINGGWKAHTHPSGLKKCAASFTCTECNLAGMTDVEYNADKAADFHTHAQVDPETGEDLVVREDDIVHQSGDNGVRVRRYTCNLCGNVEINDPQGVRYRDGRWRTWGAQDVSEFTHVKGPKTVVQEATCGTKGVYEYRCTDCNYVMETGQIPTTGNHTFVATTYAEGGYLWSADVCAVCGLKKNVKKIGYDDPAEATYSEAWEALAPANCEQGAWLIQKVTTNLGTFDIPWSDVDIENPAYGCEEVGGVWYHKYSDNPVKRATLPYTKKSEHKFGAITAIADATCTQYGLEGKVCENCGKVDHSTVTPVGKALGHTISEVIVPATCGTAGYSYKVCTTCNMYAPKNAKTGDTTAVGYTEALSDGQKYDQTKPVVALGTECSYAWKVLEPSTPFEMGTRAKVCTVCNHELAATKESIAKTTIAAPAVKTKKTSAKVTVKAVEGAVQYQILVNGKVKVKNAKVGKNNVKKLKKNTTYKFQVKAIDTNGVEAKSAVKKAKTKKK